MAKSTSSAKSRAKLFGLFDVLQAELSDAYGRTETIRFAFERQLQRMRKRARVSDPTLKAKALAKFLANNELCRITRTTLDSEVLENAKLFIAVTLERFTRTLDEGAIQTPLELSYLFDRWRFGPGTSNGVEGTHAADKLSQDMTCTAPCEPFVQKLRALHPYLSAVDAKSGLGVRVVEGSRLDFVLKNEEQLRTIAMEPSGNMCLQLAAGEYIQRALAMIGLDITAQAPLNKALAQRGSISGDLATLDLSSASDMIRTELVRQLWPKEWYYLLCRLRSQSIQISDAEADQVPLWMISTMGNGFTFPLMTLTIVALIYGYRATYGRTKVLRMDWTDTAVFGDDIIIPVDEYDLCVKTLHDAGLVVNHDKSYCSGPFRESCGGDYFKGTDVTPFYVKSLTCDSEVYVAINQVLEWCGKLNVMLPRTLRYLRSQLVSGPYFVPEWHGPGEGIRVSNGPRRYTYLALESEQVPLRDETFAMTLALGGYITESAPGYFNGRRLPALCPVKDKSGWIRVKQYLPRGAKIRYRARSARLLASYLDGWDPLSRSLVSSQHIALIAQVVLM